MRLLKGVAALSLILLLLSASVLLTCKTAKTLSSSRTKTAEIIADTCIDNWPTYGRLPSVAIGQAFVESGLGTGGSNLFGVKGGRRRNARQSTIAYLKCLNNKYFRGEGSFILDREKQLSIIMRNGRYCAGQYPGGSYWHRVISSIYKYGWDKYDEPIFKMIEEQKAKKLRKKRQKEPFKIMLTHDLEPGTAIADPDYIPKGSTLVYPGGHVEVVETQHGLNDTIYVSAGKQKYIGKHPNEILIHEVFVDDTFLEKTQLKLQVFENAKG